MEVRLKTSADNQIYVFEVGGSYCSVPENSTVLEAYPVVSGKYFLVSEGSSCLQCSEGNGTVLLQSASTSLPVDVAFHSGTLKPTYIYVLYVIHSWAR